MFRSVRPPLALLLCVLFAGAGCDQLRPGDTDERREANFQAAYNLGLQGLADDAIKAFYRALEANPHNATAHRELGQIYYERKHDFIMAIYHLRRCQQIKTARNDRDANDYSVEETIKQSKLQLAIEFNGQIGRQQAQSQVDDLKRRNGELEATIARLSQQLGRYAQANPGGPAPTSPNQGVAPSKAPNEVQRTETANPNRPGITKPEPIAAKPSASPRTHVVKSGETPAVIARQYGLTTTQLMAANKGVDARRLRPGQSLSLPEKTR